MDDDITRWVDDRIEKASRLYRGHGPLFRVMWVLVALIVVLSGLAMIVFPGPVTVVAPFGLAMLAVVFGWARRLLLASVRTGVAAKSLVEDASTTAKVLGVVALACLAAAVVVLAFVLV